MKREQLYQACTYDVCNSTHVHVRVIVILSMRGLYDEQAYR